MNVVRRIVMMAFCAMLWSAGAQAQEDPAANILPKYPFSTLEQVSTQEVPDYRLVLGQLRVIGNEIRSEQRWLSGEVKRITYQLTSGHNSQAAFSHYRDQLKTLGAEILFSCSSRDCGRSSEWATDVFKIANLYGVDREQNYLAARLEREGQLTYVVLYTIMRGNQRVYAHLELMTPSASPEGAVRSTSTRPLVPLRGDDFAVPLQQALADFIPLAQQQPDKLVWVVVHTGGASVQQAQARGERIARRVELWLVSRGLVNTRIKTLAVGPLAPAHDPAVPAERAEFFLLDP